MTEGILPPHKRKKRYLEKMETDEAALLDLALIKNGFTTTFLEQSLMLGEWHSTNKLKVSQLLAHNSLTTILLGEEIEESKKTLYVTVINSTQEVKIVNDLKNVLAK